MEWSAQGQKLTESEFISHSLLYHSPVLFMDPENAHLCIFLTGRAGPAGDLTVTWAL